MNIEDARKIRIAVMDFRDAVAETGYAVSELWNEADYETVQATLDAFPDGNAGEPHYPFECPFDEKLSEITAWCDGVLVACGDIVFGDSPYL